MKNKRVSLIDIVKLSDNEELSESYVRYICGIINEHQYRHQEILDIKCLLDNVSVGFRSADGFIYGYIVPQLNKEFDLLKISESACLNIELKSEEVSDEKLKRQLLQNLHYLKLLNKRRVQSFIFISSTKSVYTLGAENVLLKAPLQDLSTAINIVGEGEDVDLDKVFTPSNILVSPLNSTDRFLKEDYLLTENQENIKKAVITYVCTNTQGRFAGITGGPGTGKTLLIYDIARELAKSRKILIVHSGILCDGHYKLNASLGNIKIISAKELRLREIKDVDVVIVDEAHRLYTDSLDKVVRWVKKAKAICLFSYDAGQTLSSSERRRRTAETIDVLCTGNIYRLTNKIRTNKELALFITCLRDLTKYRDEYSFPNVTIVYEPKRAKAIERARIFETQGYTYISFTPSLFNHVLDYQRSEYNTHNVIGQEFEGVCMVLDYNWYYENGRLAALEHPNPDYLFGQLLYQGLTRVRSKLALIVCSESVLAHILPLLKKS